MCNFLGLRATQSAERISVEVTSLQEYGNLRDLWWDKMSYHLPFDSAFRFGYENWTWNLGPTASVSTMLPIRCQAKAEALACRRQATYKWLQGKWKSHLSLGPFYHRRGWDGTRGRQADWRRISSEEVVSDRQGEDRDEPEGKACWFSRTSTFQPSAWTEWVYFTRWPGLTWAKGHVGFSNCRSATSKGASWLGRFLVQEF